MSDDEPHCSIRQRAAPIFDVHSLELGNCHSLEVNTPLNEFELRHANMTQRFSSWPPDVQRRLNTALDKWSAEHPERVVRLVSNSLFRGVAVVILHHLEK